MKPTVRAFARLRSSNQLTLPDEIVEAAGFGDGDMLTVELDMSAPDVLILRRIRASHAGALKGMYEPTVEYLEGERAGWD